MGQQRRLYSSLDCFPMARRLMAEAYPHYQTGSVVRQYVALLAKLQRLCGQSDFPARMHMN